MPDFTESKASGTSISTDRAGRGAAAAADDELPHATSKKRKASALPAEAAAVGEHAGTEEDKHAKRTYYHSTSRARLDHFSPEFDEDSDEDAEESWVLAEVRSSG